MRQCVCRYFLLNLYYIQFFFMSRSTETSYLLTALRDLNYLIIRHVTKARRPIIVYTVQYVVLGPAGFTL